MAQDLDLLMEKACSTTQGALKATFILRELERLAPHFQSADTRDAAEEALTKWSDIGGDPLRKGIAMAWLARARAAIAPHVADALSASTNGVRAVRNAAGAVKAGAQRAQGAVTDAYHRAEGAAGNLGAAAGEKLANSPLNAKRMAGIRTQGGAAAQSRMADRLRPPTHIEPFMTTEAAPSARMSTPQADPHSDALASAFRSGADHAAAMHAQNAAKVGRVAARHAFKAGAMLGAAGAGVAAAGAVAGRMSQKQHDERVEAGKHSHQGGGFGKTATVGELEKGIGSVIASGARLAGSVVRRNPDVALATAGAAVAVPAALAVGRHMDSPKFKAQMARGARNESLRANGKETLDERGRGRGDAPPSPKPAIASHVQRMVAMNTPKTPKARGAV